MYLPPTTSNSTTSMALLKTHKQNSFRLTFSSVGTSTRNLLTYLDTTYIKPILPSFSPRRLADTKQGALSLDSVNKHIWENNIKESPRTNYGVKKRESNAVINGLKVVRNGSFFRWKE